MSLENIEFNKSEDSKYSSEEEKKKSEGNID